MSVGLTFNCVKHAGAVGIRTHSKSGSLLRAQAAQRAKFGPAFHADPGSWTAYSEPSSVYDGGTNAECPYPPCRQLRSDLIKSQTHKFKRREVLKEDVRDGSNFGDEHDVVREDRLKPSPLNAVEGGANCLTCEEVLVGEGLNPRNVKSMSEKLAKYLKFMNEKILKSEPKPSANLKKHMNNVRLCGQAFKDQRCTIKGKIETVKPVAPILA
jgi:hypothetical protein